ncbi:uncharacterized protein PHALS_15421 [Plasmopara halstedii]|uniref:Uncharacterized protein n=1 Tax=Plasmopara halstedii TaxID=4781 RepID=A0A0P1AHC3_PLAHL|nr:uncharacterized protein PHALS_15421 [Plasmopara halstedii]CEG40100.1 hypothetical protein PHALS_15421 [Plasmopara halstedii]|eukprot:XP_024576469.1 hypothetical protein PHALS_15421 [Plasmopara halstedii]
MPKVEFLAQVRDLDQSSLTKGRQLKLNVHQDTDCFRWILSSILDRLSTFYRNRMINTLPL